VLVTMSESMAPSSTEEILNNSVEETPSRDEALQSRSRTSTDMMLTSRPRIYDLGSESVRAAFETGQSDGEESQYHFASASDPQAFPTSTALHVIPMVKKYHWETHGREGLPQYEITQTGLKFKGNVKGIKIIATQVASKTGQYTSEYQQSGDDEQTYRSKGQQEDSGFVQQSGALFLQSVANSQAEVNQSAGGKDLYKVKQAGVEVGGEATECSFPIINQRVW